MEKMNIKDTLYGNKATLRLLLLASMLLLFLFLGVRDIWTQEHRWADITWGMLYRQDYFHPFLGTNPYFDKPLLSYWLILLFSKLTNSLTVFTLRLPSACAGLLAVWSIFTLGSTLKNRSFGLLAGWMLLTTSYFIFWSRTSNTEMLNMAGSLFAVTWYAIKRDDPSFMAYAVFFIIIALTSLCKGLIGAVVPLIAISVDIALKKSFQTHCRPALFLALIPAIILYLMPFLASAHFGDESYSNMGLYHVYRENILRFFHPFDHREPIYIYFIYFPIYLLPWTFFFMPAVYALKSRWKKMPSDSRWIAITTLALFVFFTLSGSRRDYYILPLVPFGILLTADWLETNFLCSKKKGLWFSRYLLAVYIISLLIISMTAWRDSEVGTARFAGTLQERVNTVRPWKEWHIVLLDADSKLNFYLKLPPTLERHEINGDERDNQTTKSLEIAWPILQAKPANTIFITRKQYKPLLDNTFNGYQVFENKPTSRLFSTEPDENRSIAYFSSQ